MKSQKTIIKIAAFFIICILVLFGVFFIGYTFGISKQIVTIPQNTNSTISTSIKSSVDISYKKFEPQYYPETQNYTFKRQKNIPFRCDSSLEIIKHIMNRIPNSTLVFISNSISNNARFKMSANEPYYGFPTEEVFNIELPISGKSTDSVWKLVMGIVKELENIGFSEDTLNSTNENMNLGPRIAIKKEELSYILKFANNTISISCIHVSPEHNIVIDTLREINKVNNFGSDTVITVWEASDNLIMMDISQVNSAGGSAQYWAKINGAWKVIYSGQSQPWCEDIEQYKVGLGISCYRKSSDGITDYVKY